MAGPSVSAMQSGFNRPIPTIVKVFFASNAMLVAVSGLSGLQSDIHCYLQIAAQGWDCAAIANVSA